MGFPRNLAIPKNYTLRKLIASGPDIHLPLPDIAQQVKESVLLHVA